MATVYILYSNGLDKYYIGSCLNLELRIQEHKQKKYSKAFTSKVDDWELFFNIDNLEYNQARKIENHIKKMKNTRYIRNLKLYDDITKKLIARFR